MPSTPSTPARRSAPARAWAASSASCSASTRAASAGGLARRPAGARRCTRSTLGLGRGAVPPRRARSRSTSGVSTSSHGVAVVLQLVERGRRARRCRAAELVDALGGRAAARPRPARRRPGGSAARRGPRRWRSPRSPSAPGRTARARPGARRRTAPRRPPGRRRPGSSAARSARTAASSLGVAGGVALQAGDDAGVEQLAAVALAGPGGARRSPRRGPGPARAAARRRTGGR